MKLLEPIAVGKTTFKNRLMFPPLTTGYEEKTVLSVNRVSVFTNASLRVVLVIL